MTERRKAIIVAGMHRSGTSAVTRIVNLLGADLASCLIPPGIGNELGHWESRAVQDLNRQMLTEARSDVYSPVNFSQSWFNGAAAQAWVGRIETLVRQEYGTSRVFVLKDPRIVLFLPLWIAALNRLQIEPNFIIPFRHPLAVAASLEVRERQLASGDALPLVHGIALWLRYTLAAEKFTRGHRRSFVSFDALLQDWRSELTRIGNQLEIDWPHRGLSDAAIDSFVDSGHRDPTPGSVPDDRDRIWLTVYDALTHAAADPWTRSAAFDQAADAVAAAEHILGAYAVWKEIQVADLRRDRDAMLQRHAAETASAHRAFETEIGIRNARITGAAAYGASLEKSRDDALRHAESQEARANELAKALEAAQRHAPWWSRR